MTVYFLKALYNLPFIDKFGRNIQFERLAGNQGVLALDTETNKDIVEDLNKAAVEVRGGIAKISEAEYAEKKTSWPYQAPGTKSNRNMLRAAPSRLNPLAAEPPRRLTEAGADPAAKPGTVPVPVPTAENPSPAITAKSPPPPADGFPGLVTSETEPETAPAYKPTTRRLSALKKPVEEEV